jgi:opacity protein-like surface antigen
MSIKRKYTSQIQIDTIGSSTILSLNGEDEMKLPWRGNVGVSIKLLQNLSLGMEYEIRSYTSAIYKNADGTETKPWLSASLFHVGTVYKPLSWLSVLAGIRGQAEVFESEGNPIGGEPVTYSIYSAGCGFSYAGFNLNLTYEYSLMKYQDMWQTNVNLNKETRHSIIADVRYEIPWNR